MPLQLVSGTGKSVLERRGVNRGNEADEAVKILENKSMVQFLRLPEWTEL